VEVDEFLRGLGLWAEEKDPGWETVSYGSHADQVADVRRGGERVAVVVHGGFWRPAFTRANTRAVAVDLALRGWTTWNVEYRREGLDPMLADIEALLDLIGRATVFGHSAGGHLALWAAGTGKVERAVSLAGVTDLARAAREGIGGNAAVELAGVDPPAHADPARRELRAPALLVHGSADDRVSADYSRDFAAATGSEYLELPGAGHFEVIDPRTPEWGLIVERL
jgi:pimeloyl-ACP methyl ester carboxylesterase